MSRFLEIALRNAARGFRVIPLRGKEAFLKGWPALATTDTARIEKWSEDFSDYNCGVAGGSDVVILDSDRVSRLKELCGNNWNEWFNTYSVSSGRPDRAHFYFLATPEILEFGNRKHAEPGIAGNVFEIKGKGAQVTAEGSVHPDTGGVYRITQDLPLIPFPLGLLALLREISGKDNSQRERVPREKIGEGGRHDALVREAGAIQAVTEMDKDILIAHLQKFNEEWLDPPVSDDEVRAVAMSCNWKPNPAPAEVVISSGTKSGKNGAWLSDKDAAHLFDTRNELETAPPLSFFIDGFLPDRGAVAIAGPVNQRKTLIAANVTHSLVTAAPLFGHFKVSRRPERVIYLTPELNRTELADTLRGLGLMPFVGTSLFTRTMDCPGKLWLPEPTLRPYLPGSVVILDTAVRFMDGNENESSDMRDFSAEIFGLLRDGAATVIVIHHSTKAGASGDELTLESVMRGSGELAAMLTAAWGTRINGNDPYESPSFLKCVKTRGIKTKPFEVLSSPSGKLTIVPDSLGNAALVKRQNVRDKDGKDEKRMEILRKNPHLSHREASALLKKLKMGRSHQWVRDRREEMALDEQDISYNVGGLTVGTERG